MPILTEITTTGKTWIRANQIQISNELDQAPTITWSIEKAIEIGGETITKHQQDLTVPFDPSTVIPVRNPLTGELTGGSITKGELYALIYSTFWADAVASGVVDAI